MLPEFHSGSILFKNPWLVFSDPTDSFSVYVQTVAIKARYRPHKFDLKLDPPLPSKQKVSIDSHKRIQGVSFLLFGNSSFKRIFVRSLIP